MFDGNRTRTQQLVKLLMLPFHHEHPHANDVGNIKLSFIDDNYLWKTVMALISQGHHHRTLQGKMTLSFRVTSSIT
jgi:hypothetical protein